MNLDSKNFYSSTDGRIARILKRDKKLRRLHSLGLEKNPSKSEFFGWNYELKERPPRVVLLQDDTSLFKKTKRVLQNHYKGAYIFEAENITQALIEMELCEFDLLIVDAKKHYLFTELFLEVLQQQHEYINVLLLNETVQHKLKTAGQQRFHNIVPDSDKKSIARTFRKILKSHTLFRNRKKRSDFTSPIHHKIERLRNSA